MDLVGAWARQLLGAGTAAAIVPLAMLAALVVVAVGSGGLGGLGSLGQLVAGPQISPAEQAQTREQPESTNLARVAPPTIVASRTPAAAARGEAPAAPVGTPPAPRPPTRVTPVAPVVAPPVAAPAPVAPAPQPAPAAAPAPAAPPRGNNPVADVLDKTVGDVRALVGEVIGRLGQTVQRLVGPPPLGR